MKLSIITINLNNLEGLKKTYESIVCQTFTDYEWLVIDGGSTDGSREFIEQHQEKFAYWCSEPDNGIYNAMNKGIQKAKGEYINFKNSGDYLASKDTLTRVFGKERYADILYGYVMKGYVNSKRFTTCAMKPQIAWYDMFLETIPHQGAFIRRSLFGIVGLYDERCKIVADWKWFVKAIRDYRASCEYIPQSIAVMQDGGISSTEKASIEKFKERSSLFPNYITETDASNLVVLSLILSMRFTRFLFKIVKLIAFRISFVRKQMQ